MSELKTQVNNASVIDFINQVDNENKRKDAFLLLTMLEELSGCVAKMWGTNIIGFGSYQYKTKTCMGAWPIISFSPRKTALSLYIMPGFKSYESLLAQLGKHKIGKSCLYINKLIDVDSEILKQLCRASIEAMQEKHLCVMD